MEKSKIESDKVYKKFLKNAIKAGFAHNAINRIVGKERKAVLTEAEVEAGLAFSKWVEDEIGKRYEVIGGKTWVFTTSRGRVLIPAKLADVRLGLNSHLWKEKGSYFIV
jgi:hypothetical protein